MSLTRVEELLMEPASKKLVPSILVEGAIIYHQPRKHFYQVLFKTMVKKGKDGWEYGWAYQEVKEIREGVFERDESSEIFVRVLSLFDSDWTLV